MADNLPTLLPTSKSAAMPELKQPQETLVRLGALAGILALLISLLVVFSVGAGVPEVESMEVAGSPGETYSPPVSGLSASTSRPQEDLVPQVYLPRVNTYLRRDVSVFGVQIWPGQGANLADEAAEVGSSWVRYGDIYWNEVEPEQGQRNWDAVASFDRDLAVLQAQGLNTSVIVLGAPEWAQKKPPYQCGPIREDALDDFASFMQDLVRRYSGPPYYIKYWEVGNEPDIDPALVQPNNFFGCWGDQGDAYYGGEYYATMLKSVYPAIKAVDPAVKLVIGGLLLDCDPTNPPESSPDSCLPGKFFEGILKGGGADYFDLIAYHAYTHWVVNGLDDDLNHPKWSHRGGALLGKADFLRSVMAQYGVEKPLLMNEGGLLCYPTNSKCPSDTFHHDQAAYVVKLYSRTWANGLAGSIWYTLNGPGWRDGGLMDGDLPRPAYESFQFFSGLLKDAHFVRSLSTDQLEGYEFAGGGNTYRVYWSNTEAVKVQLSVPADTQTIYGIFGETVVNMPSSIVTVGIDPVVLVIR